MAGRQLGGADYLATVGRELLPEIEVFWTGPEIISREITVPHIRELQTLLRRKPLLWDNLHANDYDGHRFYCGPYSGRPRELRTEVSGILLNPNTEFPLNRVPLQTFAEFMNGRGDWDPRAAYLNAMRDWLPQFTTVGQSVLLEDLILLGDSYYLPYELGPEARNLFALTRSLLSRDPSEWRGEVAEFRQRATRLRECCVRMTELHHRPLFHALNRRIWELREELDLLERYVKLRAEPDHSRTPFRSDFHQPLTYRGGMAAGLQKLLVQHADGTFTPRDPGDAESVVARLLCPP